MHIEALLAMLKQLKLYGMRQSVQDLSLQNAPAWQQAQPMLETLLKAEVADREVRSVAYQMSAARFPAYRDLYGFNFAESEVDERLVLDLHRCEFIQSSQNLVFVGGPGTGKTHLATAIGVQAIQHHQLRVRFISTLELVNALELEKRIALECYRRLRSHLAGRGASATVLAWLQRIIDQWQDALGGGLDGLYLREAWRSHLSDLEDDLGGQTCTPLTLQRIAWLQRCLDECGAQLRRLELLEGRTPDAWRAELEQALQQAHEWQVGE